MISGTNFERFLKKRFGKPQNRNLGSYLQKRGNSLEVKKITSKGELEKALKSNITLMDFGTPWCAPCRLQEPIIHRLATRFQGRVLIAETNVDESLDLALTLGIRSIPTLIIFKNGKEIQRFVGLQSEDTLSDVLKKHLR